MYALYTKRQTHERTFLTFPITWRNINNLYVHGTANIDLYRTSNNKSLVDNQINKTPLHLRDIFNTELSISTYFPRPHRTLIYKQIN